MMATPTVPSPVAPGFFGRLNRFFYAQEVPYGLALLRMLLPVAVLTEMAPRWQFAREIYSSDGTPMTLWASYDTAPFYPVPPGFLAVAIHSVLLFVLVTAIIGWRTRTSLVIATVLYACLAMLDTVSTLTKYTVIANHLLLLLSLSPCGTIWSVDSWLARRRALAAGTPPESLRPAPAPIWTRRLIQLMLASVYFGAAITKIHTPAFFSGDQLHSWLMTDLHFSHPVGLHMAAYPALLIVSAYITITWEMVFLFLCWKGWPRTICVVVGTGFHVMTYFTLGLLLFPMVCIPVYLLFFEEHEFRRFGRWIARPQLLSRIGAALSAIGSTISLPKAAAVYSLPAFGLLLAVVAGGGIEIEHLADRYGERRPEGPYALKELDPEYVQGTLLQPLTPLREVDKFNALALGTFMIGDTVADNRTTFHIGDVMMAQCGLTPPHEDLWIDIGLTDSAGKPIDTVGQWIPNEMLRANCSFTLSDSLAPGKYSISVKSSGVEVLRRHFTLLPGKHTAKVLGN